MLRYITYAAAPNASRLLFQLGNHVEPTLNLKSPRSVLHLHALFKPALYVGEAIFKFYLILRHRARTGSIITITGKINFQTIAEVVYIRNEVDECTIWLLVFRSDRRILKHRRDAEYASSTQAVFEKRYYVLPSI